MSPFILEELRRVLTQKFHLPDDKAEEYVVLILHASVLVEPSQEVAVVKADPCDNRILEAAIAAGADRIVTGDRHLLDLKEHEDIRICRATDL